MDPDIFQQAWQAQSSQTKVTFRADVLMQELQHDQRLFAQMISWRDYVEIAVAILLLPVWFYMGHTLRLPWTWYLTVPVLIWEIGFIVVNRIRNPQLPIEPSEPLITSVNNSIKSVEHQIWLLRNIFWWYLLPPGVSILIFFIHVGWLTADWWHFLGNFLLVVVIYTLTYVVNQRGVKLDLEPRRRKLLILLSALQDDGGDRKIETFFPSTNLNQSDAAWKSVFVVAVCGITMMLVALATGFFDSGYRGAPRIEGPPSAALGELVSALRQQKDLVSLAAMVAVDGQVKEAASDGERQKGSGIAIELRDSWHIGGITKSINATMIARLVESGRMNFDDTVGQRFPEESIHEDWRAVTLEQLLTDTAGAPANFPSSVLRNRPAPGPQCTAERRRAVLDILANKPARRPGRKFDYSNVGCTIAAVMAESATGKSWEELIQQEVFVPLELTDAGFGPPKSPTSAIDQPRGHRVVHGRKISMGEDADNTLIMAPACAIHMSLTSLCIYATDQLQGERGEGKLLTSETYKLLHTPERDDYAYGWIEKRATYAIPCTMYWHNGSNTMWYAFVMFIPDKNMVVAVTSNDGDIAGAEAAAWKIAEAAAQRFNVDDDAKRRTSLPSEAFPKKSPFQAIRWQDTQPEVKVDHKWYQLVSIDGLGADEIVAYCQRTYKDLWRKRFEEDLVEVLTRMGHEPKNSVRLTVRTMRSSETKTIDNVEMTEENRRAIRAAAHP